MSALMVACRNNNPGKGVGSNQLKGSPDKVEIPFEFNGMNIIVKATMNDVKINLLIDNGVMWDELWFFGNEQTDSLGFIYGEDVNITGAGEGEGIDSETASCPNIEFNGIIFKDQPAIVSPPEQGFYKMFPGIAGQLCGMFFKNFITEFDFDKQLVVLHPENKFNSKAFDCSLKMEPDSSGSYSIPVKISFNNKTTNTRLYIDLGGIYPVSLVLNETFQVSEGEEKTLLGYGASGPIYGFESTIDFIKVGMFEIQNVEAVFTEDETGGGHTNLTVGLPLLMNFNLAFDYFKNVLYLKANHNYQKTAELYPDTGNRAIQLNSADEDERVKSIENSLVDMHSIENWLYKDHYDTLQTNNLQEQMTKLNIPGVSIVLMNDFKIEWGKQYGVKRADTKELATGSTVFQSGSVTEFLSDILVLQLTEQGNLDPDTDTNSHLKSLKMPVHESGEKVTL